jgi:hypothetical protein
LLTTWVVTSTDDGLNADGSLAAGTLRWAITQANNDTSNPGADEIDFAIPGPGVHSIRPTTPLPPVAHAALIDGYSQPGSSPNTLLDGDNAVLTVELDGSGLSSFYLNCLLEIDADGSTVRGLVLNRFASTANQGGSELGLFGQHIAVAGNFIGTDTTGTVALGPSSGVGDAGDNNLIGVDGTRPDALAMRNVISGNAWQGVVAGPGTAVAGNFIGTDLTGTKALGNGTAAPGGNQSAGVLIGGSGCRVGIDTTDSEVGRNFAAERNIISGNADRGVWATQPGAVIAGNYIGTDVSGLNPLGNYIGVQPGSSGTRVGTDGNGIHDDLEGNLIAGNGADVVLQGGTLGSVVAGNLIDTDRTGMLRISVPAIIGVFLQGASGCRVGVNPADANPPAERNVIASDVRLQAAFDNVVDGNYIGTDVSGLQSLGVHTAVLLDGASHDNLIGTNADGFRDACERNVITGNVWLSGVSNNVIAGNYIGLGADGTTALGGNLYLDSGSQSNRIGTNGDGRFDDAERNIINSAGEDVVIVGPTTSGNVVDGNWIGADKDGHPLNLIAAYPSIKIIDAPNNTIGGAVGNLITDTGPYSRIVVTGTTATGNVIRKNSILSSTSLAIDLATGPYGDGVTANDANAGQPGPNNWQDFPVITTAYAGPASFFLGTLHGTPNTAFTIDFYANAAPELDGYGPGQRWLGSTTAITDASGNATFKAGGLAGSVPGEWISATATGSSGTSEFSQDVQAVPLPPSSLSGVVFSDLNDDGQVDFGEQGIAGVTINLDGIDLLGNPVHLSQATDADGAYIFHDLRPGSYTITEPQQPAGYTPGIAPVGTGGGTVSGDQFTVTLPAGLDAMNYNYGERPAAGGPIQKGQTAGIGFWNNKNGQALIKALNGGVGHQLGNWLATTFPHMFGAYSGSNDLAGQSNASVASFFQTRFVVKDQKLDAQVLATALAVYVTDGTLDNTGVGTQYGFTVAGNGVATATVSVGSSGAAFGAADNTAMTVMEVLLAADAQAVNGVLYNGDKTRRDKANTVFSAINQAGGL